LWAVENAGQIGLTGTTQIGEVTQTAAGKTAHFDADENAFLGKVAGKATSYNPLPAAGAQLTAGEIYGYGGGLVIVRQSHTRTEHAPADVPALFSVYRAGGGVLEWVANEPVTVGMHRTYSGVEYVCIQAHTTQTDWTPPAVPALWAVYTAPSSSWAVGVAYKVNDVVTYQGKSYRCLQAHTSQAGWTPTAAPALWLLIP
jgi:hypothetical protein